MASVLSTRQAYIADNTNQTAPWNQRTKAMSPDLIQLIVKAFVIRDEP